MRYLFFDVSGGEEFVRERMVKCAVRERGSWEREGVDQLCGDHTSSGAQLIDRMFECEPDSMFSAENSWEEVCLRV